MLDPLESPGDAVDLDLPLRRRSLRPVLPFALFDRLRPLAAAEGQPPLDDRGGVVLAPALRVRSLRRVRGARGIRNFRKLRRPSFAENLLSSQKGTYYINEYRTTRKAVILKI